MQQPDGRWFWWDATSSQWTLWVPVLDPTHAVDISSSEELEVVSPPFVRNRWLRILGAVGLVYGIVLWVWFRDEWPFSTWALVAFTFVVLANACAELLWILKGKTVRMWVGERYGSKWPSLSIASGRTRDRYFRSREHARCWLLAQALMSLTPWGLAVMVATQTAWPGGALFAGPALVMSFVEWWFWPSWMPAENNTDWGRYLRMSSWELERHWTKRAWQQAFTVAGWSARWANGARWSTFIVAGVGVLALLVAPAVQGTASD